MAKKKKVVIADCSEEFCKALTQKIKDLDVVQLVGTANDGEQTIRMVKNLKPDILVLDLMLPKLDGIGVLKEICNMEKRPTVIATSRFVTDYVASASANLGVRYLMLKPLDVYAVIERMEEICADKEVCPVSRLTEERSIEALATNIIREIGVPAHIKGYQYLREAIIIAVNDMDVINAITKVLYPQVAKTFQTTPSRVERAIRRAVEIAWNRGDPENLKKRFGYAPGGTKGMPAAAEFIVSIADDICLEMRHR